MTLRDLERRMTALETRLDVHMLRVAKELNQIKKAIYIGVGLALGAGAINLIGLV